MATFPVKQDEIIMLAQQMVTGFAAHFDIYPSPPVPGSALIPLINAALEGINDEIAAYADSEAATTEKQARYAVVTQSMRDDLRYAEVAVSMNDEKLKRLGWSAHKKPAPLAPPDQPNNLIIVNQGPGHLKLAWDKPHKGGVVAQYQIKRRNAGDVEWNVAGISLTQEANLEAQPKGITLEYSVTALNATGAGNPSNTVTAVL